MTKFVVRLLTTIVVAAKNIVMNAAPKAKSLVSANVNRFASSVVDDLISQSAQWLRVAAAHRAASIVGAPDEQRWNVEQERAAVLQSRRFVDLATAYAERQAFISANPRRASRKAAA